MVAPTQVQREIPISPRTLGPSATAVMVSAGRHTSRFRPHVIDGKPQAAPEPFGHPSLICLAGIGRTSHNDRPTGPLEPAQAIYSAISHFNEGTSSK